MGDRYFEVLLYDVLLFKMKVLKINEILKYSTKRQNLHGHIRQKHKHYLSAGAKAVQRAKDQDLIFPSSKGYRIYFIIRGLSC